MDQVVFWHRVRPKDAACSGGSSAGVRNYLFPHDAVFAWALVAKGSTISMSAGCNEYWQYEAKANELTMGFVPFPASLSGEGATPEVAIMQSGKLAQYGKSSQPIQSSCSYQNFNPVVNLVGPGVNSGN